MKNIHVIPTDKASRLYKFEGKLIKNDLIGLYNFEEKGYISQNIYITSDEDINENDYIITKDGRLVQVSYLLSKDLEGGSKVTLTTDQDLIKDGVQAIDDEFLEWFVKNPSCEEVEIIKHISDMSIYVDDIKKCNDVKLIEYEIIIPKKESKPFKDMLPLTEVDLEEFKKNPVPTKREQKQETTSEGFHRISKEFDYSEFDFLSFKIGIEWQQQNSYSEEDMREAFEWGVAHITFEEWIKKFKKK